MIERDWAAVLEGWARDIEDDEVSEADAVRMARELYLAASHIESLRATLARVREDANGLANNDFGGQYGQGMADAAEVYIIPTLDGADDR